MSVSNLEYFVRRVDELASENALLKAEVESVRQVAQDNKTETEATRIKNANLKAEVERLRKAGDAFEQALQDNPSTLYHIVQCVRAWNAAKEGKPSV